MPDKDTKKETPVNKYEHHIDIKSTPLTPFKVRKTSCCMNSSCNWHDNLEILYITEGTGTLRYGTVNIDMIPETVIIINSQTMHSITSEKGVTFYMYIIDNGFFEENGIDITKYTFRTVTDSKQLTELCRNAYSETLKTRDNLSAARLRKAFLALILELCENHVLGESKAETGSAGSEQYVKKAMEYINDNYTEKLTLDGIAKIIGINKSYFAREFKKYAGQTVHTYINLVRCTAADSLLSRGLSVTEAAMSSGFETLSYFSRTYRKLRGVSPNSGRSK